MNVILANDCKNELDGLNLDIEVIIQNILKYIPKVDLCGVSYIYIMWGSESYKHHPEDTFGVYYPKYRGKPAYIALFLKKFINRYGIAELLPIMLPILEVTMAYTIFHEVGHHIEHTRSHGIRKNKKEKYADGYAKKLFKRILSDNSEKIYSVFNYLEQKKDEINLSIDDINKMRKGFERDLGKKQEN